MKNTKLAKAKTVKNDEFYTLYQDIAHEIDAYLDFNPMVFHNKTILLPCDNPYYSNFTKYFVNNFEKMGIKKLISTSLSPIGDNGYILTMTSPKSHHIDLLQGSGDFRSDEITLLRDQADIVITNPPFSLFSDFFKWLTDSNVNFVIITNKNSVTYKNVFPLIKHNKIWSGFTKWSGGMWFETINKNDVDKVVDGVNLKNIPSIWLTNIEHAKRKKILPLNTMAVNLEQHKKTYQNLYEPYDNYHAIEIPKTSTIPSDYHGAMGVPISFLEKYNPEQFEILGATESEGSGFSMGLWNSQESNTKQPKINGERIYKRIFIGRRLD